jgi:site-specific DNA recombinase
MLGAVIYVRVSTKGQTENLSLPTQLRACEEYCRRQGYEVLERFHEEGESAKTTDRSQLQKLLTFCRLNKGRVHFVVVFNLTRFARDKYDHVALRSLLQSLGLSLRSVTEPVDDTSTGKVMEGVLAPFAQFDNDCRSDRTRAGMKATLELGRWRFLAPIGYLNAPRSMGKSLMHDPERAALVRRTFDEYATGQFTKEHLLKRARDWGLTNRRGKSLTSQASGMLLRIEPTLRIHGGLPSRRDWSRRTGVCASSGPGRSWGHFFRRCPYISSSVNSTHLYSRSCAFGSRRR